MRAVNRPAWGGSPPFRLRRKRAMFNSWKTPYPDETLSIWFQISPPKRDFLWPGHLSPSEGILRDLVGYV